MLSYRHAFHAGNHADVLKHVVLLELLDYFGRKDKPFTYVDTHAGAGFYQLDAGYATQNAEYASGISHFWDDALLPTALAAYRDLVQRCNPDGCLRFYPGSPWFARQMLRPDDRMWLYELHPSDQLLLRENVGTAGKEIRIESGDGFAGLPGLLPPPTRRGLILIDPSYEEKQDYDRTVVLLEKSLKRFATGTYVLWYPQLPRAEARALPERLKGLPLTSWLHVALSVRTPAADGFGMYGSGLFIINPPYTLPMSLNAILPTLVDRLGQDDSAGSILESHIP